MDVNSPAMTFVLKELKSDLEWTEDTPLAKAWKAAGERRYFLNDLERFYSSAKGVIKEKEETIQSKEDKMKGCFPGVALEDQKDIDIKVEKNPFAIELQKELKILSQGKGRFFQK